MQEKVCIVLNEREPHKARAAETLVAHLKELGITASRQHVDQNIVKNLLQKRPRILILDYLLGDYSTGLDLLSAFTKQSSESPPVVFFLTDEPSVQVAVSAMRSGARNYYELDHPRALADLSREVEETLHSQREFKRLPLRTHPDLDELIAQSAGSRAMISAAKSLIKADTGIVLISGPPGSGRSTLAKSIHKSRCVNSLLNRESLRVFDKQLNSLADLQRHLGLTRNGSLLLTEIEEDDGSLLDFISRFKTKLWPEAKGSHYNCYLYLSASDEQCVRAWCQLLKIDKLRVPPLSERLEDIAPLVQRYIRDAQENSSVKIRPLSSDFIHWLTQLAWQGQLQELYACVSQAILRSDEDDQELKQLVQDQRELMAQEREIASQQLLEPYSAALALECANHSYRIAAAKLGCSVRTLRESLK